MSGFDGLDLMARFVDGDDSALAAVAADVELEPGEVLIHEGRRPSAFFIVAEGVLEVRTSANSDSRLATIGPGGVVGELSFILGRPATASVAAVERSSMLSVSTAAIESLAERSPETATGFWRGLATVIAQRLVDTTASWSLVTPDESGDDLLPPSLVEVFGEFESAADPAQMPPQDLDHITQHLMARLQAELQSMHVEGRLDEHVMRRIRAILRPVILSSALGRRVLDKPRGYAGDAETIDRMYVERPEGVGAFGLAVDRALLGLPTCHAVRNRRGLLGAEIQRSASQGSAAVTSLACGPAREIFDVLENKSDLVAEVHLVDLDPLALDDVRKRAEAAGVAGRMHLHRENLIKLALGREELSLPPQDLVYTVGLIDYLPDELVVALLDRIHGWLRPGGRTIIGNFHPENPTRGLMEVFGWSLIHRTEDEMHRLFEASAFARPCHAILWEDQHINLFAVGVKG